LVYLFPIFFSFSNATVLRSKIVNIYIGHSEKFLSINYFYIDNVRVVVDLCAVTLLKKAINFMYYSIKHFDFSTLGNRVGGLLRLALLWYWYLWFLSQKVSFNYCATHMYSDDDDKDLYIELNGLTITKLENDVLDKIKYRYVIEGFISVIHSLPFNQLYYLKDWLIVITIANEHFWLMLRT
ncbi:hypothetical protein ACJX0J_020929, partial [Zea mays]